MELTAISYLLINEQMGHGNIKRLMEEKARWF